VFTAGQTNELPGEAVVVLAVRVVDNVAFRYFGYIVVETPQDMMTGDVLTFRGTRIPAWPDVGQHVSTVVLKVGCFTVVTVVAFPLTEEVSSGVPYDVLFKPLTANRMLVSHSLVAFNVAGIAVILQREVKRPIL
jgi:hypothetical protein